MAAVRYLFSSLESTLLVSVTGWAAAQAFLHVYNDLAVAS